MDMHMFGNPKIDIDMLTLAKRTKKSYRMKEVRKGYKYACELANIDPLPQIKSVFKKCF
jgi:hypothetical protein